MSQIEALYQTAVAEHRAGRVAAAESLYRQILDQDRLFARAWHLLGGMAYAYIELGLAEESLAAYRRASELSPDPIYRVLAASLLPLVYESADDVRVWRERLLREVDVLLKAGVTVDLTDRAATPLFSLAHQGMNGVDIPR